MQTKYLTLTAASHRLGCSAAWVARLFDRGTLQGIKDSSGRRLVEEEAVDKLARKQAVKIGVFDGVDDTLV
jgi:predicted site-specific integrase-resolvase